MDFCIGWLMTFIYFTDQPFGGSLRDGLVLVVNSYSTCSAMMRIWCWLPYNPFYLPKGGPIMAFDIL